MKNKRRVWVGVVVVLLVAVVAYGLRGQVAPMLGAEDGRRSVTGEGPGATIPVGQRDIVHTITATGNVAPVRQVDMRFSRAGRVQEVHIAPGERVEKGQLLAMLDNREPELAYFRARNAHEIALIDAAPNEVREREIDTQLAEESLEQTYLRAPFAGVVIDVFVDPGESVGTGDPVVQIVDDSVFEVQVAVDELDIAKVEEGQSVTIRLDADPGATRSGIVERVSSIANVQGNLVTVPVTVRFLETDPFLRSGYTATLQILVAEARNALVVPVEAIWEDGNVHTVTRVRDGHSESVRVETGLSDGAWIEIRSGLDPGDEVVALNYRGGSAPGGSAGRGGFGGASSRQIQLPGGIRIPTGR